MYVAEVPGLPGLANFIGADDDPGVNFIKAFWPKIYGYIKPNLVKLKYVISTSYHFKIP
jgi:hypothetical protein